MDSCFQGHHVFKNIWTPTLGEQLPRKREICDNKDWYVAAALRDRTTVGHVSRKISAACTLFLQREGSNYCVLTKKRCFHLPHSTNCREQLLYKPETTPTNIPTNDCILADFNLAVGWSVRQTAKFNSLLNFPAIRFMCTHPHSHVVLPWQHGIPYSTDTQHSINTFHKSKRWLSISKQGPKEPQLDCNY